MNEIEEKINQIIKDVSALETLAQVKYNHIFDAERQNESELMLKLNMLANIGSISRRILSTQVPQMTVCCGVLNSILVKETENVH